MSENRCELLSPAGGFESLKAAIENGADAVYLGGKLFNARQFAGNFDSDDMLKAIEYAHLRGVKLYLTLNTLIRDHEIGRALEYAAYMREQGIDAIIVQDLGFASELRRQMPDLPLHASTQMTIYDINGAKVLEKMGFERIVTARELSIQELKDITSKMNIEVEVFVHGALCISYSGQCLMSSMIGGRSGNRGTCTQNCRMKYELYENLQGKIDQGYLLSTRDINAIKSLKDILEAGVRSLKIEGRMKSPEYVGLVTSKYRKALDHIYNSDNSGINEEDEKKLMQIFNRGGFSRGYFYGKNPKELVFTERPKNMGVPLGTVISYDERKASLKIKLDDSISIGDGIEVLNNDDTLPGGIVTGIKSNGKPVRKAMPGDIVTLTRIKAHERGRGTGIIRKGGKVIKTSEKELNERISQTYTRDIFQKRRPISGVVSIKESEPMRLKLLDNSLNIEVEVEGDAAERARAKGLTEERVKEQIAKTGDVPFSFSSLEVFLDEGLHVPVSSINDIRRRAFTELSNAILNSYKRRKLSNLNFNPLTIHGKAEKQEKYISLYIYSFQKLQDLYKSGVLREADRVYLPVGFFMEKEQYDFIAFMKNTSTNFKVLAVIPNIIRGRTSSLLEKLIPVILNNNIVDGLMIGNLGEMAFKTVSDKLLAGDIGLNAYNTITMKKLADMGIGNQTFSPELKPNELPILEKGEYIVYGRIPVMTTEHNPVERAGRTGKINKNDDAGYFLKNPRNDKFPIIIDVIDNRTVILSSKTIEIKEDGIRQLIEKGINGFRINIFQETPEETRQIIKKVRNIIEE